jgi:uncharacterized repeat protein (TIGR03803 family)
VYKIAPDGTESVFYAFQGGSDGAMPEAGLIADASGNLYGTTISGGDTNACTEGCGTVFKVTPGGQESVLYAFHYGADGANPEASVILDSAGNIYGTTFDGGGIACKGVSGCGTVFELAPDGTETVLYAFQTHPPHGRNSVAPLLLGNDGVLYGTATQGGAHKDGVVFKVKK